MLHGISRLNVADAAQLVLLKLKEVECAFQVQ